MVVSECSSWVYLYTHRDYADCIEKECRDRVMRLLSSEVKPSPDIVFSWICENCVKFSYSELRTCTFFSSTFCVVTVAYNGLGAVLSKSEQKFVDLSTQNCTPETKSCGGFGEVSVVDLTQMVCFERYVPCMERDRDTVC